MIISWAFRSFALFLIIIVLIVPSISEPLNQTYNSTSDSKLTPDLSLTDVIIFENDKAGKEVSGTVIVENSGPLPATRVNTDFVLIRQDSEKPIFIWLGNRATEFVQSGLRGKVPFSFTIPKGASEGKYILEATISADEHELFIDDNTITAKIPVIINESGSWKGEHPNLVVTIDGIDKNVTSQGSPLNISYTISNTNKDSAGSFKTAFYLTSDKKITSGDYQIRTENSYSVYDYMNEKGISEDLIPDNVPPGTYYLGAIIDYSGMIPETNETDNQYIFSNPITISTAINLDSEEYTDQISGLIFLKTNKYREYLGLSLLTYDSLLSEIAYEHTIDMITRNFFSHYTPEGINPEERAKIAGYETSKQKSDGSIRTGVAENIIRIAAGHTVGKAYSGFVDPTTPEEVADIMMIEWINSPEHNKNLINPDIEKIGIGTKFDGEFFYATQDFF